MEKYGTIPPKFTKEWWSYFWEYYKIHTISAIAALLLVGMTVYQCETQTKYDLSISYIGTTPISEESEEKLKEQIAPSIDEITGNKNIDIFLMTYGIDMGSTDNTSAEYAYALNVKFMAELQSGTTDIYIMSKSNAEKNSGYTDCFIDITTLSGSDDVVRDETGKAVAVSLKDSRILKNSGIDSSDMYLMVRDLFEKNKDSKEYILNHENSLKAATLLLEQ